MILAQAYLQKWSKQKRAIIQKEGQVPQVAHLRFNLVNMIKVLRALFLYILQDLLQQLYLQDKLWKMNMLAQYLKHCLTLFQQDLQSLVLLLNLVQEIL